MAFLDQAHGPGGVFIIRAQPWNYRRFTSYGWFGGVERWLTRRYDWNIEVRRFADDPLGAVVYDEQVERKALVAEALEQIRAAIRAGSSPFG